MRLYLDESVQLWLKVTFNSCHVWERRPAARCPVYNSEWNARLAGERGSTRLAISQLAQNIWFFFLFPPPHTPPTPLQAMKADAAQMVNIKNTHKNAEMCEYLHSTSVSVCIDSPSGCARHSPLTHLDSYVCVGKATGRRGLSRLGGLRFYFTLQCLHFLTIRKHAHKGMSRDVEVLWEICFPAGLFAFRFV